MIIDAHCHIYPDKIAVKATLATGRFYSQPMLNDGTVSMMIKEGEKAGIDRFVVESVATTPKQVSSINRFIAGAVAENPGRLYGLGTLHPESEDIRADFLEIVSLGLKGVKLHPDIQGFKLDDYRCLKMYELCEEYSLPLLIHAGDPRYDFSNPNRLIPIAEIYTGMSIVAAHFGGWSIWERATEQLHGLKNVCVDCSSSMPYLSDETIVGLIRTYGADRVLFGTDYPMWNMKTELDRVKALPLTDDEKELILGKNAVRVYKLDE